MTGHKLENANDELIMELAVSEMLEMFGRKLEEELFDFKFRACNFNINR